MRNSDGNYQHPLLHALDEMETRLYAVVQETVGDPDPATRAVLERWTPEELGVSQDEIDAVGALAREACDTVSKMLNILTRGYHPAPELPEED